MTAYLLAAEGATSMPDALVTIAFLILVGFIFWLMCHD